MMRRTLTAGLLVIAASAAAQDFTREPGASPRERIDAVTPRVDRITQRSFASLSLDDVDAGVPNEMASLCWARLDGVWRETGTITLDRGRDDATAWGSDSRELVSMANGKIRIATANFYRPVPCAR